MVPKIQRAEKIAKKQRFLFKNKFEEDSEMRTNRRQVLKDLVMKAQSATQVNGDQLDWNATPQSVDDIERRFDCILEIQQTELTAQFQEQITQLTKKVDSLTREVARQKRIVDSYYPKQNESHNSESSPSSSSGCSVISVKIRNLRSTQTLTEIKPTITRKSRVIKRKKKISSTEAVKILKQNSGSKKRRSDMDERPYKCPIPSCGRSFKYPCNAQLHKKAHLQVRSFKCPIPACGKTYVQKNYFDQHVLMHSQDKPFACPDCKLWFRKQSGLNTHVRRHHN